MRVWRGFSAEGVTAIYDEAPGGGDPLDFNAPCNAPAKSPHLYLAQVYWHSEFFQYELAMPIQTKTVAHAALAGITRYTGVSGYTPIGWTTVRPASGILLIDVGNSRVVDHVLVEHNLGYAPQAFVSRAGRIMPNGEMIQTGANLKRRVSAYATDTVIGLREYAKSSNVALPAISETYQTLVLRNPAKLAGAPLAEFDGTDLRLGRGKVDTANVYLRRTLADESNFDFDQDETIHIRSGRSRTVSGGIVTTEPGYTGSFAGGPFLPVGV